MSVRAALLASALLLALPGQAQMYKCVDARGVTHYSDKPRSDCKGAEVNIRAQPPISGKLESPSSAAEAEGQFRDRQLKQTRAEREQAAADETQKRRCERARSQHRYFTSLNRVSVIEKGERRYLDDNERAAQLAKLEAEVAAACR